MASLAELRREYANARLDINDVERDPIVQFEKWMADAQHAEIPDPNAMSLASVDKKGRPSCRIVLLKGIERGHFLFYTNYQSRKGHELDDNPACALTFYWPALERQVRIEGVAFRVEPATSDAYFRSRPRGAQLGAWASPQSSMIKERELLDLRMKEMEERFSDKDVTRPHQWGGYAVQPLQMEFWQGRVNRLHDRILFVRIEEKWQVYRLAP